MRGTEIVISYAGTNPNSLLDPDYAANFGLATGFGSVQLLQAAEYYLQVKAANSDPNMTIALTGHSLGGGLAALVGVFFGVQAVTFDQAPFAQSATPNFLPPDVAANLKATLLQSGHTEAELAPLTDYLERRAVAGGIPNSDLVTGIAVSGELLSGFPYNVADRIGLWTTLSNNAPDVSGVDLHSQALLTAFLQSLQTTAPQRALNDVTHKLTDLLGMLFDENLYQRSTDTANTTERNFLERLVQNEAGNAMVTRFTSDLWKLVQDGGLTIADDPAAVTNFVSKALIAFTMQMYYEDTANATNANKELFADVTGGVHFDRADVAATVDQAKGYNLYFQNYLNSSAFTNTERQLILSLLPNLRDWYVQAGPSGMIVADTQNRGAFTLGGKEADTLVGGTQADLLVGNAGTDILNGRGGHDVLLGGAGFDTYIYTAGGGADRVEDGDDRGMVQMDGILLVGGLRRAGDPANTFQSTDGTFTYLQSGTTVTINGQVTIENWKPGELGLTLRDLSALSDGTPPVINYANGQPTIIYDGDPTDNAPFFTAAANHIARGFGGNDILDFSSGSALFDHQIFGGDDHDELRGGAGDDRLFGEAGRDLMTGGPGDDVLDGGRGDRLDPRRQWPGHALRRCGQ